MNFIEVCAGCGGLSTGLIEAGLTPLLLNDLNKDACATLRLNHPPAEIRCCPMDELDLSPYAGRVDVLAGGIPCQSFSYAGKGKGLDDPRGNLFNTFARLVRECEPGMFIIENVRGLLSNKNGSTFRQILEILSMGGMYEIRNRLLNAKYFQVPQHRERVFIVGIHKKLTASETRSFQFPEEDRDHIVPLRDALKDVPLSERFSYSEKKKALFARIPQGGCWVDLPEHLKEDYLGKKTMDSGGGKRGILRRLHMDHPSLTLLCTPSQKQTERCHPLEDRPLCIREYARIQTFPDTYEFSGSLSSQYRQIGNAVPVRLALQVGLAVRDYLSSCQTKK